MPFDVVIVGGGAAGLFCARTAGLRGRRVVVLEHQARLGNKILISGGGRCNFTNRGASATNYLTQGSPHFAKSALARYTPQDFLALVEFHGLAWHEKKLGQLFCDHSSKQILQMLETECADAGVVVRTSCEVTQIRRIEARDSASEAPLPHPSHRSVTATEGWSIATSLGTFEASSLVIATGGLSFPKLGATPFGYRVAEQFGIPLIPPRPGLVPLCWGLKDLADYGGLSGLSVNCETSAGADMPQFRENLLFTHRGLSGPAILQISSYWRPGDTLRINLLPEQSALDLLEANRVGGRELRTILRGVLPDRFVQAWCGQHTPKRPLAQLPQCDLENLARLLNAWEITPAGDEGYAKAEVTVGGVDTRELSSKSLECRSVPGLFFIGEVVDVTGWLGGYNFQWAWASGHAAGQAV